MGKGWRGGSVGPHPVILGGRLGSKLTKSHYLANRILGRKNSAIFVGDFFCFAHSLS